MQNLIYLFNLFLHGLGKEQPLVLNEPQQPLVLNEPL
jgi:hypothetical protein